MSRTRGKRESAGGGWHKGGDPFEEERQPKKRTKKLPSGGKGAGNGKRAAIIALCCVAALAVGIAGWWMLFVRAPDVTENDRPGIVNNNPNLKPGEEPEDGDGSLVTGRKDDYFTFLLIGRDTAGGGNTDTLILVSYDVPNGQVNMMSIPRDTAINVPWSVKKINSVYNAKESSGGGMEGLKQQVAYLTGVMPDRHVIIEWKAVGRIVDAVGGVEFDVPRNMNYDDPYQDLHIHFNKGMQKLDGQKAMELLRYRHDNDYRVGYNDTGRMNTQRDFLKAMAKKVLKLGNIAKIGEFIDIFMENVETDMTLTDMMWFASKAISVDVESMQSSTLPYIDVGRYRGGDYLLPNGPEIVPLVNEQFNPYNRDVTLDDLRIIVKNPDGSCYVTGGELLDSRWASPVKSSEGTAGGGVSTTEPTGVVADPNAPTGGSSGGGSTGDSSSGGNGEEPPAPTLPSEGEAPPPDTDGGENPDIVPEPDPGTNPDTGTDTEPDPGANPDLDAPPDPGVTPDPGTNPDTGTTEPGGEIPPEPVPDPSAPPADGGGEPPEPVLPDE